mgnify:CR=1 FL=1
MLRFAFATAADVPAIVAIVERAYRGDASRAGWTTEADFLDDVRDVSFQERDLQFLAVAA